MELVIAACPDAAHGQPVLDYWKTTHVIPQGLSKVEDANLLQEYNASSSWQGRAADVWSASRLKFYLVTEGQMQPEATSSFKLDDRSHGIKVR